MDSRLATQHYNEGLRPDGEAASEAEQRAARREKRLQGLASVRERCEAAIARLDDGTACRLPFDQHELFERVRDPYLAMARLSMAVERIAAREDRLDQDDETRAALHAAELAAEREAAECAARDAEAERLARPLETKKHLIRRVTGLAHRDLFPELTRWERDDALDQIFEDYEEFGDWTGDPLQLAASFCRDLTEAPEADLSRIPEFETEIGDEPDPDNRAQLRWRAWAAQYMDWLTQHDAALAAESAGAPPAQAQGPPELY